MLKPMQTLLLVFLSILLFPFHLGANEPEQPVAHSRYYTCVQQCLDTLIKHGVDLYGARHAPIFVSILDVDTLECPRQPLPLDEAWRVIRRERRNPAGANLYCDRSLMNALFIMSQRSGDEKYAQAAQACIAYYFDHLVDEKGLLWWGSHRHYDVYEDKMTGHLLNWHEIYGGIPICWEKLWQVNPAATQKEIEAIWQWHVINKTTGETNRHDDGKPGCDFPLTAGSMMEGFAFLYGKTNDTLWLDRAKLIADYFWQRRNTTTNMIAERPNAGTNRFDGSAFATDITGPYCLSLLACYQFTGDALFRDQAVAYLKAYNTYGFDPATGKFWGALKLDGTPIPGPRLPASNEPEQFGNAQQYAQYEPRGHLDLWEPYILGSQYPLETALCFVQAYRITKDADMLLGAQRFADWIKKTPTTTCETDISWYAAYTHNFGKQGTYAGKYAQAIDFYLGMYSLAEREENLRLARTFADEAIDKLYHNGLFKGHPAKPYYEAVDGVGELLVALLHLDEALSPPAQKKTPVTVEPASS
ncbi:MAG: AGE family epimerase/isomerase [Sedimentisphaerales bacterium]|nr:AGE family epimerase/isomerase [Sedimentisphaerales bacterium]